MPTTDYENYWHREACVESPANARHWNFGPEPIERWLCSRALRSVNCTRSQPAWPLKDGVVPFAREDRESASRMTANSPLRGKLSRNTSVPEQRTKSVHTPSIRRNRVYGS